MLAVLVWLLIFVVLVTMATILIKIVIEFPGLLRLKCVYNEGSEEDTSEDVEKSRKLDLNSVLAHYDNQVKKNVKCKYHLDNEDLEEFGKVRRHKHSGRPREKEKLIEETTNDEDISIEINEDRAADIQIPTQLRIKLGKTVRLAEEVPRVEQHKHHGHVRQH